MTLALNVDRQHMMTSDSLPLNAISSIVLASGQFCHGWDGPHMPFVLQRVAVTPAAFQLCSMLPREQLHTRPPSKLPPPGNLTLQVNVGPQISKSGRIGSVYQISCAIHHGNESGYSLPPLVAKVAKKHRSDDLRTEASYYEDLECLQGCAIPRCYGFFEMRSPDHPEFGPVSVLILERLGERLPLGEGIMSISPITRKDLCDIGSDLAELGVCHGDVRWENILSAPTERSIPGSLPSLPSPFTGRTYAWRMVDLDQAVKTNATMLRLSGAHEFMLERVFINIPDGDFVQPWE